MFQTGDGPSQGYLKIKLSMEGKKLSELCPTGLPDEYVLVTVITAMGQQHHPEASLKSILLSWHSGPRGKSACLASTKKHIAMP
jgi:hypothetical protein